MKKFFQLLAILALCSVGAAKAADTEFGQEFPVSISNSIINDNGAQAYTNLISGSRMGIYSGAADNTDTITWTLPVETVPAKDIMKFRVRYRPVVAALDAAPDCTLYRQRWSAAGLGTTLTATTFTLTEDTTTCAVTKDVSHLCTAKLATPFKTQRGDQYSVACTFNRAATTRLYIESVGLYSSTQ